MRGEAEEIRSPIVIRVDDAGLAGRQRQLRRDRRAERSRSAAGKQERGSAEGRRLAPEQRDVLMAVTVEVSDGHLARALIRDHRAAGELAAAVVQIGDDLLGIVDREDHVEIAIAIEIARRGIDDPGLGDRAHPRLAQNAARAVDEHLDRVTRDDCQNVRGAVAAEVSGVDLQRILVAILRQPRWLPNQRRRGGQTGGEQCEEEEDPGTHLRPNDTVEPRASIQKRRRTDAVGGQAGRRRQPRKRAPAERHARE